MDQKDMPGGVVHAVPQDLGRALRQDKKALSAWESLTPLARNEWICWVESVKKAETREEHVTRLCSQLNEGKRRPCCWMGCVHRKDKALSRTQKFLLKRKMIKRI